MYNEEESAPLFFDAVDKVKETLKNFEFEIVAVNDGSKDGTLDVLKGIQNGRNDLVIVNLSRNFGQEPAVRAGLLTCTGDCAIPMDADLQDPPEIIPQMIEQWENGFDVVNAKRGSRKADKKFKKNSAGLYYRILNKLNKKVKVPENVGNYRLIDRKVLDLVNSLPESNRVFRVEVPFAGYKTCEVEYARPERCKGESKYPMRSMVNLALDSMTSLSTRPLRYPLYAGIAVGILSMLSLVTELVLFILTKCEVMVIDDFMLVIWLVASIFAIFVAIVLGFMGLMGIYVGATLDEARARPNVIIDEVIKK